MYSIGVDLGGTNIAIGAVDKDYKIISYKTVPTNASVGGDSVVETMAETIKAVMAQEGLKESDCTCIGIGAPGTCDVENGIVFRSYSMNWTDYPVAEKLAKHFNGIPVRIDNDANCAALGEVKAGAAKGFKNAVLVTLGTGVGTGIIINGKIFSGLKGNGTEMGHVSIDMNGPECLCGRRGCWDYYASATGIIRQGTEAAEKNKDSLLAQMLPLDGKKIFDAADKGDETALQVIAKYCEYLAIGTVNVVNVFAPEIILVGGGISRQGDRILEPVREYVKKYSFDHRAEALPLIKPAMLGNEAGIVGAAALE